ncbi:50S ribosomal protein L22 [Candidatus Woesearchaeota archaeon]|nr:50S ribosomal protein L22 [Candidatus Woesearchaeota archaeon]
MTEKNTAQSKGISLAVSTKKSIEICNKIRGKNLATAKKILNDSINLKRPIPMTRFNKDTGHKHGMAAGRFAVKACKAVLETLLSAEANAQYKGLATNNLLIKQINAYTGPHVWRYGRQRRRQAKRTHVHVTLGEEITPTEAKK